jgi:hypothetical protein
VEPGGTPAVIKQVVGGTDPAARYAREVQALRLAARAVPPIAPALLATDDQNRVMVLEHLTRRRPGPDWAIGYAEGLARLHATTGPGDAGVLPAWCGPTAGDVEAFLRLARTLDAPVPTAAPGELAALLHRLAPAGHHALLHGDPCPGNDVYSDGRARFLDFEQASLGNGLVELAYLRVGFPTCWASTALPAPLRAEAEETYRSAWKDITGTEVAGNLTDACLGWLIRGDALVPCAHRGSQDHLARVPKRDWSWGTPTARERLVHRLGVVTEPAGGRPEQAAVRQLTAAMRERMMRRWPALRPLPSERPAHADS